MKTLSYIALAFVMFFSSLNTLKGQNSSAFLNGDSYLSPGAFKGLSNKQTVEFWAFKEVWKVSQKEILLSNFENGGWVFSVDQNNFCLSFLLDGISRAIDYPVSGLSDGWHHYAFTFDGNYVRFYIDGYQRGYVFDYRSAMSLPASGTWLCIGADPVPGGAGGSRFEGLIDEVRMWNKTVSVSELRDWMHRKMTGDISPDYLDNLILYYTFDQSDPLLDYSSELNASQSFYISQKDTFILYDQQVPAMLVDDDMQNTRALWNTFGSGVYSEPSGGLNLGITNLDLLEVNESIIWGHNGLTGILSEGLHDGVDFMSQKIWHIDGNHNTEKISFRCHIFDAGAGALFYDCIPVNNYKLMYKYSEGDTFSIISEAQKMEGSLVFFENVWADEGYYAIARDNDLPAIVSDLEVKNIACFTATLGGSIHCDGGAPVTAYGVCLDTTSNPTTGNRCVIAGAGTGIFTAFIDSLEPGLSYYVRIFATNSEGTAYGNEIVFQTDKMYQSISFSTIPVKVYGDTVFDPGATATSGLEISYSVSNENIAELTSGGRIKINGTGSTSIWAYQSGNTQYSPTSYKKQTLTVNKGTLIIEADDIRMVYGDSLPELKYTISGFAYSEDEQVLGDLPILSTDATVNSNVGVYEIYISGASAENYICEYKCGGLELKQAELYVKAEDKQMAYGDTLPELTYTIKGFVMDEDTSVIDSFPKLDYKIDSVLNAGSYEVTPYGASSENYHFNYEVGHLTIEKSDLVISARDTFMVYGDSLPKFSYEISGFVNGETEQVLLSQPGGLTDANSNASVGIYTIAFAGADAANYNIIYNDAELSILKRNLTLTADDKWMVYGDALPELTYNYSPKDALINDTIFTEVPVLGTEADINSDVGIYSIFFTPGHSKNYNINYQNGILRVLKARPEVFEIPEIETLHEGDSLANSELLGGTFSTNGNLDYSNPAYVPDSTGEEVAVIFTPEDTLNYFSLELKVGVIVDGSTHLGQLFKSEFSVYPNPFNNTLYLKGVEDGTFFELFDLHGRLLYRFYWFGDPVFINDVPQGMYILKSEKWMKKLLKQ